MGDLRDEAREAIAIFRRIGVRAGLRAALRRVVRAVRLPIRRRRLTRNPLRVRAGELDRALGGRDVRDVLRGSVLSALPTVAALRTRLADGALAERDEVVRVADAVLMHRFELFGGEWVEAGDEIAWRTDLARGREWPNVHISVLPIAFGDGSDIRAPIELSRFQHLPVLAAAYRLTGDRRYLDELAAQLDSWIDACPVEFGPAWFFAMDVGIRAANWLAALALVVEDLDAAVLQRACESLLLHGRFIRSNLEHTEIRGNHYLADIVGLLTVAAPFAASREGAAWVQFAVAELEGEMEHQVRSDGGAHEASIPYHRLVAELFLRGTEAADALAPAVLSEAYRRRLAAMVEFTRNYTRPDGLAPLMGDDDSSRYLPLLDYGRRDPRDHRHLLAPAEPIAAAHAAFPASGWYVMRSGPMYAIARCGDVGLHGLGGHAHNDQLSFELAYGDQPLVIDPGTYVYTADPAARNAFRSTAAHATLRVDGAEQNDVTDRQLFRLLERTHARCTEWSHDGARALFAGTHEGFCVLDPPARHSRRIEFHGDSRRLVVEDRIESDGDHEVDWAFPLAPGCEVSADGTNAIAQWGGVRLILESDAAELRVEDAWYAPRYRLRERAPALRARRRSRSGQDVERFVLSIETGTGADRRG